MVSVTFSFIYQITNLIPPVHSNQIAEPLVSELVRHYIHHAVLVLLVRSIFIEEDGSCSSPQRLATSNFFANYGLPVSDEAPVLHGTV